MCVLTKSIQDDRDHVETTGERQAFNEAHEQFTTDPVHSKQMFKPTSWGQILNLVALADPQSRT